MKFIQSFVALGIRMRGARWFGYHAARKSENESADFGSPKGLEIMRTGCDVHHGFQQGRGQRGAGLSGRLPIGFD
jgi:hypothetical protein